LLLPLCRCPARNEFEAGATHLDSYERMRGKAVRRGE
jgi:hypothetical protein